MAADKPESDEIDNIKSIEEVGVTDSDQSVAEDSEATDNDKPAIVTSAQIDDTDETKPADLPDKEPKANKSKSLWQKILSNKKLSIPAAIVILIAILMAIPFSRYTILGTVMSHDFEVLITDSTTGKPVSSAEVELAGKTAKTDADGKATLKVKVGYIKLKVDKKYYQDFSKNILVTLHKSNDASEFKVVATGRQVPIEVLNRITGKGLADATIKAADTEAKTDNDGKTILVLPADKTKIDATISASGFNDIKVSITVTDKEVTDNNFNLTPSGKIYFLSKLSGKIDVIKTNLDGTDRQTVLAGTGKEEETGTVLLASRDWKYLALLSKRDSGLPKLYLIETSDDKLTTMDEGDANFNLVGWSGSTFVYTVDRNGLQLWKPKQSALKSYNAQTNSLKTLDQTAGLGASVYNYATEYYGNVYEVGNVVVYEKDANSYYDGSYGGTSVDGKLPSGIYSINTDGTNKQTLKTFSNSGLYGTYISSVPFKVDEIYYQSSAQDSAYYVYKDGKLTSDDSIADDFDRYQGERITYLQSPSGNNTFWTESRDGKQSLFVGDSNGNSGKQIASLTDLTQYGWYTDDYLLASKNGSELYILGKDGGKPIKITDYHKPDQSYYGYGGGYGGL